MSSRGSASDRLIFLQHLPAPAHQRPLYECLCLGYDRLILSSRGDIVRSKALLYIVLLGVLYGSTLVVSRFSVNQFAPTTYIGLRLALASLGFAVVYGFHINDRRWPRSGDLWSRGFLMGVFGTAAPMVGIVSGLQYLSSGLTSILITVNPALTVLLAHVFLKDEPLTRRKGTGVLLALSGALLLVIRGETGLPNVSFSNPVGYLFVLGGMISGSLATVYARKYMQNDDPFDVTGIRMFVGAFAVLPLAFLVDGLDVSRVDRWGVLALIFAAIVGTFLGMLLSFYNIQRFGATAAVMTSYVIPVVAGLIGVIFLNEQFTWGMAAGVSLISIGVWLINSTSKPEPIGATAAG